jgi:diguanylate cyclase (GGDEF)-like protein
MLVGNYDDILVTISFLVAVLASYTALDMAGRVAISKGRAAKGWLVGGAFAMGFGIWSMHFIGMLAFSLPISLGYDVRITLYSLIIAIAVSAFALHQVSAPILTMKRLAVGAMFMGTGIASMHYVGMEAMRMQPPIQYDPWLFIASVLIAIAASGAALWIFFQLRKESEFVVLHRSGAALVMGGAIVGMHYTGMAAANFPYDSLCLAASGNVNTHWLALVVIIVTVAILVIALLISVLDARMEMRTRMLADANRQLSELLLQDNLTKLPNRLLLEDRLNQALKRSQRDGSEFSLMFMDIDSFKAVNDVYGHHIGDALLIEVGQRLRGLLRTQDTVARIGGDEFVLLLEQTGRGGAEHVAAKLVECISRPCRIGPHEFCVSASVGIAIYASHGTAADTIAINADAAMYHSKHTGGNRYSFFEPFMEAAIRGHLRLVKTRG